MPAPAPRATPVGGPRPPGPGAPGAPCFSPARWTVAFLAADGDPGSGADEEESKRMESEPGADASGLPEPPGPAGPRPATGDSRVDEAVAQLEDLAGRPVAEHPAIFERVHRGLTEALGDAGARERAAPDGSPGQPGR